MGVNWAPNKHYSSFIGKLKSLPENEVEHQFFLLLLLVLQSVPNECNYKSISEGV